MAKPEKLFRVGVVPIDGFALMSYSATVEPLRAANLLSGKILFETVNIPVSGTVAVSSSGVQVPAQATITEPTQFDLILVVAGGNTTQYNNLSLANWLRRSARSGTHIGGVSAGPLYLARIGLLSGYRMTVHWEHSEVLAELVPDALFERSLYVIDRDRLTCGGGTAPIDLMLALIANRNGGELAQLVGDWFLHTAIRPSAGPQRASLAERFGTSNGAVLAAIEAIETHIADPLKLTQLSEVAGVSPRQLTRHFQNALQTTPIAFGHDLRLEKAHSLLIGAPLSLSEIALMTGFSSASHFSTAFTKKYGEAPSKRQSTLTSN